MSVSRVPLSIHVQDVVQPNWPVDDPCFVVTITMEAFPWLKRRIEDCLNSLLPERHTTSLTYSGIMITAEQRISKGPFHGLYLMTYSNLEHLQVLIEELEQVDLTFEPSPLYEAWLHQHDLDFVPTDQPGDRREGGLTVEPYGQDSTRWRLRLESQRMDAPTIARIIWRLLLVYGPVIHCQFEAGVICFTEPLTTDLTIAIIKTCLRWPDTHWRCQLDQRFREQARVLEGVPA